MSVTKVSSAMQDLTDDYAFSGTVSGAGNPGRGTIGGLTLTNDGTDAAHDIGIAVGFARDYTDAATMSLTGALIKKIDATWAVGTNAGGLDSTDTVAANTGYGVYLIRRSDTGVVDVLMSSDMTAAGSALTMPTNYDQKRLIGWVRTDASSNIYGFTQRGDSFWLTGINSHPIEISDSTITSLTYETVTISTPPDCIAYLGISASNSTSTGGTWRVYLRPTGSSWGTPSTGSAFYITTSGTFDFIAFRENILVNSSSQVDYAMMETSGSSSFNIGISGCTVLTRSNP